MRKAIFLTLACMFALAVSTGGPIGNTYAEDEEYDYETGVVLSEDVGEEMAEGVEPLARTISLSVPATVNNGDVFTFSVSYSPPISGTWIEKFIFEWPSRCEGFKEKTTRIKQLTASKVSLSNEITTTPSATCVEGIFEAKVIVYKGTKVWKAKALMEVINP
jgi:hypothetical protein